MITTINADKTSGDLPDAAQTTTEVEPAPTRGSRALLWTALFLVLFHSAAIALWVSPNNILKDRVGYDRLRSYVVPLFDQAWSVFAPEADNAYDLLEVRATLTDASGEDFQTDWVKVTAREVGPQIRYHPFPSRTALMTDRLANDQLRQFRAMNDAQKKVVNEAGIEVTTEEQENRLLAASTTDAERLRARAYTRTELAIERFLSGIAVAVWGSRVVAVQFRQNQIFVPTYQRSKNSDQVTSDYSFVSNVRPLRALSKAERKTFRDYAAKWDIR